MIPSELAVAEEDESRKNSQAEIFVPDPTEDEAKKILQANELDAMGDVIEQFLKTEPQK